MSKPNRRSIGGRRWLWALGGLAAAVSLTPTALGLVLSSQNDVHDVSWGPGGRTHSENLTIRLSEDVAAPHTQRDRKLLLRHAPIVVHWDGNRSPYDDLRRVDYDGDENTKNNVSNAPGDYDRHAYVYGQVLSETEDAHYLLYLFYHLADYDKPWREFVFDSSSHDNDLEGIVFLVMKDRGVIAAESWYHSIFLQFTTERPRTSGSEVVDGKLHLDGGTRPYVLIQDKGHGVRALQVLDLKTKRFKEATVYFPAQVGTEITPKDDVFGYALLDFVPLVKRAADGDRKLWSHPAQFLGGALELPLFLAGDFTGNNGWARPKPPWNWNDKFQGMTGGALYFDPAMVFAHHLNLPLSQTYVRNVAVQTVSESESPTHLRALEQQRNNWFFGSKETFVPHERTWMRKQWSKLKKRFGSVVQTAFYLFG